MQTEQGNMLQSLRSVKEFLERNKDKLAGVVHTGARERLDAAIAALEGHATSQSGSALAAQGATQTQRALRAALLRDHMAPISGIAHADLPHTPALKPLRMPRGKPTPERLATAARGMAEAAAAHAELFVAAGLSTDFIAQLNQATDAMLASLNDRVQSQGTRKTATSALKSKLSAGRKIVRVLDTFVKKALVDDPHLLDGWKLVKRVAKTRANTATTTAAGTPTPTPTPTPAAATAAA
jgi:hypothetical protein